MTPLEGPKGNAAASLGVGGQGVCASGEALASEEEQVIKVGLIVPVEKTKVPVRELAQPVECAMLLSDTSMVKVLPPVQAPPTKRAQVNLCCAVCSAVPQLKGMCLYEGP